MLGNYFVCPPSPGFQGMLRSCVCVCVCVCVCATIHINIYTFICVYIFIHVLFLHWFSSSGIITREIIVFIIISVAVGVLLPLCLAWTTNDPTSPLSPQPPPFVSHAALCKSARSSPREWPFSGRVRCQQL